jgi:YhcH/YjgK/YiaL family protein
MIFDEIKNWEKYKYIHPKFEDAFKFLNNNDIINIPPGEYLINGRELYVSISKEEPSNKINYLEAHREYIDIQIAISGSFEIGHKFTSECKSIIKEYNSEKDVEFFEDPPNSKILLSEKMFAVFFPNDGHLPYPPKINLIKAVFKLKTK